MDATDIYSGRKKVMAALVAAGASLALVCAVMLLSSASSPVALKSKEDLSIFADSSVSFYEPGDTAADSDILPRQVLADDGSATDHAESTQRHAEIDYADSHWYKAGQSQDVHGDLQEENRAREQLESRKLAHEQQLQQQEHQLWIKREQERAMRAEQVRLQQRRRAAMQELSDRRVARAHEDKQSKGSEPLSYKAMRSQLHSRDAAVRKDVLRDSFAYQHPFAAGKKGMQNLVMAEFKEDENKMAATTDAIFGRKKAHSHQWRHGGLLLSDASHPDTLHSAMQRERAERKVQDKARAQLLAQEHAAKGDRVGTQQAYKRQVKPLGCTIEQLENGGCSRGEQQVKSKQEKGMKKIEAQGKKSRGVVEPSAAPTAGTVISGWAKNVGSWF